MEGSFMVVNHNLSAVFANRHLEMTNTNTNKNIQKLSSGMRITSAADDASGLAVSEKMRSQIRGLQQATKNAQMGISFIQTTEGYLNESHSMLQRIRELSVQAANGIYTDQDRNMMQREVNQLVEEVSRVASHAAFNNQRMLTGAYERNTGADAGVQATEMRFQIGANAEENIPIFINDMRAEALGIKQYVSQTGPTGAATAVAGGGTTPAGSTSALELNMTGDLDQSIRRVDQAIERVSTQRSDLGAYQNRLEHTINGLMTATENAISAESTIRDTDMAQEMVKYVKNQVLTQSGAAMLANANLKTQAVMRLLG